MCPASATYSELDKRWRQVCSLLFGGEVGGLDDYKEWLSERTDPVFSSKSALSGREISYANGEYCKGAAWVSFDEIDFGKKFPPLSINDVKDIDSVIGAVQERAFYAGNVILGNSKFIEKSANVSDSFYVYESSRIGDSKYIAYSSMARLCECVFGTAAPGESQYMVLCNDTYKSKRCFELWMSTGCSDCHYVFALTDCDSCMFCFSLTGARYAIGNLPLGKEKFSAIKQGLLEQMRSELVRKKRLPSLTDIAGKCAGSVPKSNPAETKTGSDKDMRPIEEAFSSTSKIVLGVRLEGLDAYAPWLTRHIEKGERRKSVLSGRGIFVGTYAKYGQIPPSRTVTEDEALRLSAPSKKPEEMAKISLANAHGLIADVAYFHLDYHAFTNRNIIDCMAYAYSSNAFNCFPCVEIKDSAYNFWPRSSERLFGCGVMFDSQFCINCHQSVKLSRCFEVDSSRDCSDCYFCHNIENCQNCMFCFNVKNLRYAIGNAEVGREKFAEAKEALLKRVGGRLQKEKDFPLDIFNLGCRK
jgi:hypothetical protein